ncbi:MAG: cell division protein FtsA [bacterium]
MASGRNTSIGIDIGTSSVKVIAVERLDENNVGILPKVIGYGTSESKGIRHGYIANIGEVAKSIRTAVAHCEKNSGLKIRKAYLSVGGVGLSAIIGVGVVNTTKADSEITDLDVRRAIEESEKELPAAYINNRKIIHSVALEYRVDGKRVLGRPQGMKGIRLEARVLYITCQTHHLTDMLLAVEEAGIEIEDVVASPMASSLVALNKTQKIAGCVLVNIGAETTSMIVFENNIPISLEVFPIGSTDITNDIALGLQISLEEAELVKTHAPNAPVISRKKLDGIIEARLSDIFELIDAHLKKIDRSGLLPAGIIMIGGGSSLVGIEQAARSALHLPSKCATIKYESAFKYVHEKQTEWVVAYGLGILGLNSEDENTVDIKEGMRIIGKTRHTVWKWIKQFLP